MWQQLGSCTGQSAGHACGLGHASWHRNHKPCRGQHDQWACSRKEFYPVRSKNVCTRPSPGFLSDSTQGIGYGSLLSGSSHEHHCWQHGTSRACATKTHRADAGAPQQAGTTTQHSQVQTACISHKPRVLSIVLVMAAHSTPQRLVHQGICAATARNSRHYQLRQDARLPRRLSGQPKQQLYSTLECRVGFRL